MKNNMKVNLKLTRKKLVKFIIVIFMIANTKTTALDAKKDKESHAEKEDGADKRPYLRIGEPLNKPMREGNSKEISLNDEEFKNALEKQFKFRSDDRLPRYKIEDTNYLKTENPKIDWIFRSYAARRIVGGMQTQINMYPYNVAIARNGMHWCGGSVIDEQWVLTAGHCIDVPSAENEKSLRQYIVRAGSSYHSRDGYQARINRVFFPRSYSAGNADYDMSLLRLDRPWPIGRSIAVLNLPAREYTIRTGDMLIVTGWGSTYESGYGHISDRLRFVPVPVLAMPRCQKSYSFYITPRMVCAGYDTGGMDACNHDSGGPAVKDGVLLGIVSFGGKRCGDPQSPGVYTRVSELTNWVESTITHNEAINVPELIPKIKEARLREKEIKVFKSRVEEKKDKIKIWLTEALKSPVFIELAKKKLDEAEIGYRRNDYVNIFKTYLKNSNVDDDFEHSNNQHRLLELFDSDNDTEKIISRLALRELIKSNDKLELFEDKYFVNSTESIYMTSIDVVTKHKFVN